VLDGYEMLEIQGKPAPHPLEKQAMRIEPQKEIQERQAMRLPVKNKIWRWKIDLKLRSRFVAFHDFTNQLVQIWSLKSLPSYRVLRT